jgi:DNA-binding NtrC family response regulator
MLLLKVVAVEQVVAVTSQFLAASSSSVEALKSATLLQGLQINALIYGGSGSGKKTLASTILPNAPIFRADNFNELIESLKDISEVIVTHFETLPNSEQFKTALDTHNVRLIATSSVDLPKKLYDTFFSIKIELLDLVDREEDIELLVGKFLEEFSGLTGNFTMDSCDIAKFDLSENIHSLKRSLLMQSLFSSVTENELMDIITHYFERHLPKDNAYRDTLHLFDIPIIKAGLAQYKSQLKLSEVLGINRNTLRKKILEHKKELNYE